MRTHCIKFSWVPFTGSLETVFLLPAAMKLGSPEKKKYIGGWGEWSSLQHTKGKMEPAAVQSWSLSVIWLGAALAVQRLSQDLICSRTDSPRFQSCTSQPRWQLQLWDKRWCSFPQYSTAILSAFKTRSDLFYEKGEFYITVTPVLTCPTPWLLSVPVLIVYWSVATYF